MGHLKMSPQEFKHTVFVGRNYDKIKSQDTPVFLSIEDKTDDSGWVTVDINLSMADFQGLIKFLNDEYYKIEASIADDKAKKSAKRLKKKAKKKKSGKKKK